MYTQGKGYLMYANVPHTCWALMFGYNMSVLLLIVGWSIGQGRYGVPADLTAWGGAPPGGNFGRPCLSSLHKGGTALNKKLLLLLAHHLLLLLFIAACSGFAQLLVIGKTIGD